MTTPLLYLLDGEGLFLARLRGPGRLRLQTMPFTTLASSPVPLGPFKKE